MKRNAKHKKKNKQIKRKEKEKYKISTETLEMLPMDENCRFFTERQSETKKRENLSNQSERWDAEKLG